MEDHEEISSDRDPIGLLTNIKTIMFQFQTTKYMTYAIHDFKRRLYLIRQDRDTMVPYYYKNLKIFFKLCIKVEEDFGMSKAW